MAEEDPKADVLEEEASETTDDAGGDASTDDDEQSEVNKLKEEIEIAVEDVGTLRKKLTITVPRDSIDRRLNEQYDELSTDAVVPGFRKGRAPRRLIEKRFGHDVGDQVCTQLVSQAYMAATEKEALKTLGDPMIWITPKADAGDAEPGDKLVPVQEAFEVIELPDDGPFTLVCEVEVRPEFDLPVLEGIPVERPKITIGEDDVTEQIDRIRSTRGSWEPVEDGPIEADDLVVVDLKMTVDGETITETENAQVAARPQVVENVILEKLGEALISKQVGDVCTTEGQIAEDDAREKLRGKKASFELTVQDIKRLSLPPLDEAFLTSMGFETEEELRKLFREQLEARLDQTLQSGMRNQVQRYLLDNTKLELPEQLSMRQTDRAVTRRMLELQSQGVPKEEIDKHLDEMKTQTSEQVADELKLQFIMDAAAEDAEVEVTEEDLNNEIAVMARQYNVRFDRIRDELAKGDGLSNLYIRIRDTKILDDLIEDAKITEIDGPDKTAEADKSKDAGKKTKAEKKTKKKATKKATSKSDDADAT